MKKIIDQLDSCIENPADGLPEDLFLFVSGLTPMVNVDLLIKNAENHTLLAWRDDGFYPCGWHVPGGIIRYKETMADRIRAVAAKELGAEVTFAKAPMAIHEVMESKRRARGHFISLLFKCTLIGSPDPRRHCHNDNPRPGDWAWHPTCPNNLLSVQAIYRKYL